MALSCVPPAGKVTTMQRGLLTAAVAMLAFAGCSPTVSREESTRTVNVNELVAVEGPVPTGRFYVKAGDNDLDADLYELRFSPHGQERITTKGRVSSLDGCETKVVVSAAQREVGLIDHLQELSAGKLAPVDKLGLQPGSNPDVAPDCRVLYLQSVEGADGELEQVIVLFDPAAGTTTTVARGRTVASASWGPDGEIVILRREAAGPVLVVQRPDGSQRELDPQQPDVGNIQSGRSGWMAMGVAQPEQAPTGTLFLNLSTRQRSMLDGWLPLAWSPDGAQLLVAEAKRGTTLAVVDLPNLAKTRNVGVSEVGTVWDAVWLPG
jgi:hypothetical protein